MSDLTHQHTAPSDRSGADDPARRLSSLWRQGQEPRVEDFLAQMGVSDPAVIVTKPACLLPGSAYHIHSVISPLWGALPSSPTLEAGGLQDS